MSQAVDPSAELRRSSARRWAAQARLLVVLLLATWLAGWLSITPARAQQPAAAAPQADSASAVPRVDAAAFTVQEFDWLDSARQRAVPVRLYLPAGVMAGPSASLSASPRPLPLIVFSHGIGGSRRGYSYLGQFWASQGYASLHLQHVGSDRALWSGNLFSVAGRLLAAAQESEATARVRDLSFALDQLLAGPLAGQLDANRIVAAGHSYGANTTLLAVGARVQRDGQPLALHDRRIKAAIVISAPPFYGEPSAQRILGAIDVPSLHITATDDVIRVPGYYSPASDRLAVFDATGGVAKTLAVFEGGSHSMFTDRAGSGGALLNAQVKAATQALSVAFLASVFDGDASGLRLWAQRFGGLLAHTSIGLN